MTMSIRTFVASAALAAATAVPTISHAGTASRAPCILDEHHVVSVVPYQVEEHFGKHVAQRLRGAQIFIQAEPGLTAEWLQLNLERHITAMQGPAAMLDCAFDLSNVRVDVTSAGSGFW